MYKKLIIFATVFILQLSSGWTQQSEIECTIVRKSGTYLTLAPAHFDPAILPKMNDKVHLFLLIKTDLAPNRKEGYYELFSMTVIKVSEDSKSISFKCDDDIEVAREKTGMQDIHLNSGSRVRIAW